MKPALKRIEAALHQLADKDTSEYNVALPQRNTLADRVTTESILPDLPTAIPASVAPASVAPATPNDSEALPLHLAELKTPTLPRLKTPSLSSHRNVTHPTLALSLLKQLETTVAAWQDELQQTLRQIQDIYIEGPIVDGWLESYAQPGGDNSTFRHADVECLMNYVEKMGAPASDDALPSPQDAAGYRLCGLDQDGQLWFRHCPAEQVPTVGVAIARYQRLRILLSRKQSLETRLSQLAQTLIQVHAELHTDD